MEKVQVLFLLLARVGTALIQLFFVFIICLAIQLILYQLFNINIYKIIVNNLLK